MQKNFNMSANKKVAQAVEIPQKNDFVDQLVRVVTSKVFFVVQH